MLAASKTFEHTFVIKLGGGGVVEKCTTIVFLLPYEKKLMGKVTTFFTFTNYE